MKIGKVLVGFIIILSTMLCAQEKTTPNVPDEVIRIGSDSNAFAFQFLNQLSTEGNLSFSPYSISSAFAMVYAGAKGETFSEISKVFHFPQSIEDTANAWSWVNNFFTVYPSNSAEDIRVRAANSLWVQNNFPILPTFRDLMNKYFNAAFRFVDFKSQPETARSIINAWVKQNTFGKISEILSPQIIDSRTRMILISALYLKAKWLHQFDAHITNQQPFFTQEGHTQTVSAMTQSAQFLYLDNPEAAILEMPYISSRVGGPEFAMLLALPHQKEGITQLEKELNEDKFKQWVKELSSTKVVVTIPKFKFVQFANLNDQLEKMGLHTALKDQADFSGMTGVKSLKIGNILHKVYLSVDETGSEAGAATAVSMQVTAVLDPKPPVIFDADHPFLYFIYEKKTGIILFMGRVADPNKIGE